MEEMSGATDQPSPTGGPGEESNRRVQKGEATRLHVVAVATELFSRDGFEATTIEAVLTAAGISKGALYHHFAGKDDLFEAVFVTIETDVIARVGAAAQGETTAAGALAAGCKAWLRLAGDPVVRRIVLIDAPAALGWHRWRELDEIYPLGLLRLGVGQLASEAGMAEDLVDGFAHVLLAAANELALLVAAAPDIEAALERANRTIDLLLGGLLPPRSPRRRPSRRPG
jgi:AcrR family transcriptional regulator